MNTGLHWRILASSAIGLILMVAVAGCGKGSGNVSGKVTLDGKPVSGGSITFACLNAEGKVQTARTATIDEDGSYRLAKVPEGPVKITVQGPGRGVPPEVLKKMHFSVPGRELRMAKGDPIEIPERYTDDKTTDLTYTVTKGDQQFDVKLVK